MKKNYLKGLIEKSAESENTFTFLASTSAIDRQGDSVDQKGWDLKNFLNNPVIVWAHNYSELPIGKALDVKVTDSGLEIKFELASMEGNPKAQQVKNLIDNGFLNAGSVGFIPKTRSGNIITSAELLEFSIVPVPANQEALRLAISKGLDVSEISESLEKGDVQDILTEDEVRAKKYENMDQVWDIISALCRAYFADDVVVEDFKQLLTESISLLSKVANGEEVVSEPAEGDTEPEEAMEMAFKTFIEKKSGKVLSKKNKTLIGSAVETMKSSVAVLEELLKATDSSTDGDGNEDDNAGGETAEVKDIVVEFTANDLIKIIKQNAKATDRGNETTLALINKFEDAQKKKVS